MIISIMGLENKRGMLTFSLQSTPVTGQHCLAKLFEGKDHVFPAGVLGP